MGWSWGKSVFARLISGGLAVSGLAAIAIGAPQAATAAPVVDPSVIGTAPDVAAGSCWEIKQVNPAVADGTYWVVTPQMLQPLEVYCDMTTDGGGWVLVGKGRDGWTTEYAGKGPQGNLLTAEQTPMSSATAQMPSTQIDALLGGKPVSQLAEGVRLRRATNAAGTAWQEVRMRLSRRDRWAWTFGAEHPLSGWSFDGVNGSGGTTPSFGSDNAYRRVVNTANTAQNFRLGFAFGSLVAGSNDPATYLWSATNGAGGAIPFTQVYLRPRISSTDAGFTTIGDTGLEGYEQPPVAANDALDSPWGVTGIAGTDTREGSVEVQAFTQSGNTMYVGGNFAAVQQDGAGTGRVAQPFLAAFDVDTGEWKSGFRPDLNDQVKALATLPNGAVVAGGDFTRANGAAVTSIVVLDPQTGATRPGYNLTVENRSTSSSLRIQNLLVSGNWLYLGGRLTHMAGGSRPGTFVATRNLGRVSLTNFTPGTNWNPGFNGTVVDTSASPDGTRIYASGHFGTAKGITAYRAAALTTAAGAAQVTPAWNPVWSNTKKNYQQAIHAVGDRVWVGGSEHSIFSYDPATFQRLSGNIFKRGGDVQALTDNDGVIYTACHCNNFNYSNAFTWSTLNSDWTQADAVGWLAASDQDTGETLPQFTPAIRMRLGSGPWALKADTTDTLWVGGDITAVRTSSQNGRWSGGFARFPQVDSAAPAEPANLTATDVEGDTARLSWSGSSEPGVTYVVLRDDRPVAVTSDTSITVNRGGDDRYFVRAIDRAGNYSATTPVLTVTGVGTTPTARMTTTIDRATVSVDGTSSTGPSPITDYQWDFGDGAGARGATATHTYAEAGAYTVTLTVTDADGLTDDLSRTVMVGHPGQPAPSDVYGAQVYRDSPYAYFRLGEASGSTAADSGPDARHSSYNGVFTRPVSGALVNSSDTAVALNDFWSGFVVGSERMTAPNVFSLEIWFRTTSFSGGRLIGFGDSATGLSSSYDRHLFLRNDGRVVFGAFPGTEQRITTDAAYNDGGWHHAVATMGADGMKLYVDGQLRGTNPTTSGQSYAGHWRIGTDRVWSGASRTTLTGSLDEAAIYHSALSAEQVAEHYRLGSTVIDPPATDPPVADIASETSDLTVSLDGSGSHDPDGSVVRYDWDLGDGTQRSGQLLQHTYAEPGTYHVTLTVTDDAGAIGTAEADVTVKAPPTETRVIERGSSWRWYYQPDAPPTDWRESTFDDSAWPTGAAILGWGSSDVATDIDTYPTTADRPRVAYYRSTFDVSDPSRVRHLLIDAIGDDGFIVYVNGEEVGRQNMADREDTHTTMAPTARRTSVALANPLTVEVPASLLQAGANTISASVHVNYRGTPDLGFDLGATLVTD